MVNKLQLKVIGYLLMGASLILLLWGLCTWNKQVLATALIAGLIAATILYYARQLPDKKK